MSAGREVGVRWTIGNVSRLGFEALRLSIWGAWKILGPAASFVVCVNSLPLDQVRVLTGDIPKEVIWHKSTANELPAFLLDHLDTGMSEGVSWKFAPVRAFPRRYELSLDNDCILWEMPTAIRRWLETTDTQTCILAEDVRACFGQFASLCRPEPRNSGIRGLPPGFDLEGALRQVLEMQPVALTSELDEQGLQTAAVSLAKQPLVVTIEEVTICSPFPPHIPYLGRCGAHFVGLNVKQLPWELDGRPATEYTRDNWCHHRTELYERVGVPVPSFSIS
jgi:hypothetical protein